MNVKPVIWSIGGSDSSGGAGVQRDLLTFSDFGVHGCNVVTMLTAQNSVCVQRVVSFDANIIHSQINVLHSDSPPKAIKLGALGSKEVIQAITNYLYRHPNLVICDPVFSASVGGVFLNDEAITLLTKLLFPHITLLTPNIFEAERLASMSIRCPADMEIAAKKILKLGVSHVLLKGGHIAGSTASDYFCNEKNNFWLQNKKIDKPPVRGTGCILSSAITASVALGYDLYDALVIAKMYISQEIRNSFSIGNNAFFSQHCGWPKDQKDFPWITKYFNQRRFLFPSCRPEPIGFYPIVDCFDWVEKLVQWGVRTIQLRIKEMPIKALEHSIKKSIQLCKKENVRLFINDYWELAIQYQAYGVHLGQEDIETADLEAIEKSGLRFGVSTHCFYEIARAHAYSPSYLALGPIYETNTKKMRFKPQGLEQLTYWTKLLNYPLVAIGGINPRRVSKILSAGANGVSVISSVTKNKNPEQTVQFFLKQTERYHATQC